MSPTKLESNHLRKIKSIGKHKLKINLGSLAGRWEAIKKWLVGTGVLLIVFSVGILIGKYYFSQKTDLVGQSPNLTVKSELKQDSHGNGQVSVNNQVKPPESMTQTVSPPTQVEKTETARAEGANAKKPQLSQKVESKHSSLPVESVPKNKQAPASNHPSDSKPVIPSTKIDKQEPVVPPVTSVPIPKEDLSKSKPAAVAPKSDASVKNSSSSPTADGLRELLQKCENLVKKNRLVSGKGKAEKNKKEETVLDCYQQVLKQAPNNVQAKAGLKKLEGHYQTLIDTAVKKGQLDDGRRYLSELQKVNPTSSVLPVAEQRLKELATLANEKNEIPTLLKQCGKYFKADRLLSGKGGSAYECYNQVLAKEPNHVEAKAGLKKIETRYQQLAESFLKHGQLPKARNSIQSLQQVNPNSPKLAELQKRLTALEQPVISSRPPSSLPPQPVRPSVSLPPPTVSSPVSATAPPSEKLPARVHKPAQLPESPPTPAPSSPRQPSRCSEIFIQESLGIQPLTAEEREFKKKFCN